MRKGWPFVLICALGAGPAAAYDTIRFLEPLKSEALERPVAAAAGAQRLYVLDEKKGKLLVFGADGQLIKAAGRSGSSREAFSEPQGVAVAPDGRVFVADTGNSRIQELDADGNFVSFFAARGSEPGRLKNPRSVAVGTDGRIYVADTDNDRVQVFTSQGILLFSFGSRGKEPGRFKGPTRVMVDAADQVYVLDAGNGRIQKFDSQARLIREFGFSGDDFAVDAYGFFYGLDAGGGKVVEISPEGAVLGKFGSAGSGVGQYKKPAGIAVGPNGLIIVADAGNKRVQRAEIVNKLKAALVAPSMAAKITVTGPSLSWPATAGALAALGKDAVYAYLPGEGQFAVFDDQGRQKARFGGKKGKGPSATKGTAGFAVTKKMGLYVSDTPNNRVQIFTPEGEWKANFAESQGFFDSQKKEGRVRGPRGVAINDKGTVYVADSGNRRIDAFSPEGVFLFGFGPTLGDLELGEPSAIVWDKEGFVTFADKGLKKVVRCEPSGALIAAFGEEGSEPGKFRSPAALALDGNNYLYVLDSELKRVSVYSRDGRWMTDFFSEGEGERELSEPTALAVLGSRLLIADQGKGKIVAYDLHSLVAPPPSVSTGVKEGSVELSWAASADAGAARYRVYRSTDLAGPFREIGSAEKARYRDSSVVAYERYFYRLASESDTNDVGPLGPPAEVYVTGSFNKPPVEISTVSLGNVFSSNYKWYLKNPLGSAVVANNVNEPFDNVKLTFRLKDFMDFGYDTEIKTLAAQQTVSVPLIATLNNKILEVSEDTPIQAELTLTYFEQGKSQSVSLTKPLRVYSRNAITWDNPERIANFITPKDPPVLEFARGALLQAPKNSRAEDLNANVVTALRLWDALSEHGVQFFSNPNSPYEKISEDPSFPVDYTQFPRETLRRKSGQCDDLATLIVSMLESAKVRAAVLDYPGHMALMFDTESDDPAEVGLPEDQMIHHEGGYWVPVEPTLIGRPFPEAVRKAAYAYKTEKAKDKVRIIDARKAWASFEPATMPANDWSAEVPTLEARQKRFDAASETLAADRYDFLKKHYEDALKEDPQDADSLVELALLDYQAGKKDAGAERLRKALLLEPGNAAALNNLGTIDFLGGRFDAAEEHFLKAVAADEEDASLWLNLVKTELRLNKKDKAREYGKMAVARDASLEPTVTTLLKYGQ